MGHEKFLLRIPPQSPRVQHKAGSRLFKREHGWYEITPEERDAYLGVPLYDNAVNSPPLFQILTQTEARALERQEGRAKGTALAPYDPASGMPTDEMQTKIAALETELAEARAQREELSGKVDRLIAALPGGAQELAAARPARPGASGHGGAGTRGATKKGHEPKGDEEPVAEAPVKGAAGTASDPLGGRAAAEGIDERLRSEGVTVNR